jgi:hypothetical protein
LAARVEAVKLLLTLHLLLNWQPFLLTYGHKKYFAGVLTKMENGGEGVECLWQ